MSELSNVSIKGKLGFLSEQLDSQIASFEKRRRRNKHRGAWLSLTAAGMAIAVTLLLGLQFQDGAISSALRNVAFILSGGVSFLNAWDAFFDHKQLWVRYKSTANKLKKLRSSLQYTSNGTISERELDEFFFEYQQILQANNDAWQQMRQSKVTRTESKRLAAESQ